jgi:hypothetical protein
MNVLMMIQLFYVGETVMNGGSFAYDLGRFFRLVVLSSGGGAECAVALADWLGVSAVNLL